MGDGDKILQVLTILLDNALSFTAGGAVTIFCHDATTAWNWRRDTGCGIDRSICQIWERFYRPTVRAWHTCTGWPRHREAGAAEGGEIRVERKGQGFTFTFTLSSASIPEDEK
jgi:signal transduction histidine kinase